MNTEWGRIFIVIGLIFIGIGLVILFKVPWIGKLPGDISIKGEHYQFYFPIATCLLASLIISLILYIFSSWFK